MLQLSKHHFNHSASICHYRDHQVVCWYYAQRECDDEQKIGVALLKNGHVVNEIEVDRMAGNGVVFVHNDKLYLLYSRFREALKPGRRVDRWQTCILKIARLDIIGKKKWKKLILKGKPRAISRVKGYLPRCNPTHVVEEARVPGEYGGDAHATIIPLYKEYTSRNGHSVMHFFIDEDDKEAGFTYSISKIRDPKKRPEYLELHDEKIETQAKNIIQPTIWYEHGIGYQLLARNFGSRNGHAWYSMGAPWFKPPEKHKQIYNCNNSLAAFRDYNANRTYLLWNDHPTRRFNLTLGELKSKTYEQPEVEKLTNLGKGSYPNGIVSPNGDIHVVYTKPRSGSTGSVIQYLRITRDELSEHRRKQAERISSESASPEQEKNPNAKGWGYSSANTQSKENKRLD